MRGLTEASMGKAILKSFKDNQEAARNLVTDQLFQGMEVTGKLMPEYSLRSIQVFGKPKGPWRAYETGDLYNQVFVDASKFPVTFGSKSLHSAPFAEALLSKGHNPDDTYGFTKEHLKDFSKSYTLPDLQNFVRSFLHV